MSADQYIAQQLASTGFAIVETDLAFRLRSDLWATARCCAASLGELRPDWIASIGAHRVQLEFADGSRARALTRSFNRLAERIEYVTGLEVVTVREVDWLKPAQSRNGNAMRDAEREAKSKARIDQLRELAAQEPPSHDCRRRDEILAARKELGMEVQA